MTENYFSRKIIFASKRENDFHFEKGVDLSHPTLMTIWSSRM